MIEVYAREFIAIGKHLRLHGESHGTLVAVDRKQLTGMLDRNLYDTAANKLKVWKGLKWIRTDGRHMDYPVMRDGKLRRMVQLDLNVLDVLERLESREKG